MTLLKIPTRVSVAFDRPASYDNQTISSTRPNCWIQISTVDVINIVADNQMFMTLTGELSWQCLRRPAVDFCSKNEKISLFEPPFTALKSNVRTPSMARWKARGRLYIRRNWSSFRYLLRLRRYERKSVEVGVFRRGGSLWSQISEGRGIAHQPLLVSGN